ncbi:MAG: T9SS type A sorting domain-containing protein [Candidatus Eisenbacteria bacterium]|nr:T9SS type A sorting domain-containing protein [Candidatus Eisenbacteria bacterium]
MRKCSALMVLALAATTSATAFAREPHQGIQNATVDPNRPGLGSDMPMRAPEGFARADTFCYGYTQTISGALYAVPGDVWTFDHNPSGSVEGWYAVDISANTGAFWKRIDAAAWSGHGNAVAAPIISGTASAWVGIYEDEADALCWIAGLGYGNAWCQRWESPALTYTGTGDVVIDFDYFNNTEPAFDYSKVTIRLQSGDVFSLNGTGFDDVIGDPSTNTYAHAQFTVFNAQFQGNTTYRLVFEMTADGGFSDEDGDWATDYGPFGVDNVVLSGAGVGSSVTYNYESGAQGWVPNTCGSVGTFWGVANLSEYTILDPCACRLEGYVMKFHANTGDLGDHPTGQHVQAFSPPANKGALGASFNKIIGYWDMYAVMPQANGVFYRPGWNFFPYVCPETGNTQWSGRQGQDTYFFVGQDPVCFQSANVATDNSIPATCDLISMVMEVYSSCDAFAIPPTQCTNITNFSPIFDNFEICITGVANAPVVAFDNGGQFQDGYGQGLLLSTTNAGNADSSYDVHRDNPTPDLLGDSLVISGPIPTTSTKWEARMWWRMRREGPGQAAVPNYTAWKDAVRDGLNISNGTAGQFTFGQMDSIQSGAQVSKNKFWSEFRESDDDFATEGTNNNEMIRDGILAPGTQVEYFITANYTCTPTEYYYYPDTAGKNYFEFEILPSWRIDAGTAKFPCILCVDINTGNQFFVENALNVILNGAGPGAPIPNPTKWDRYDYNDAQSNWNAAFNRSVGGNNGIGLVQMMGYRQTLLYVGGAVQDAMETTDFTLFGDWLSAIVCNGNVTTNRQGFIGNGDNLAYILQSRNPNFLVNYLGANNKCDAYNIDNCGPTTPADESFCVRVNSAAGGQFSPAIAYDVFGNWCPQKFTFDVLQAVAGGVGNRVYNDYDRVPPSNTNYAQVVKSVVTANSDNYRAVLDGYSYNHMSERDVTEECVGDSAHIVTAAYQEIREALRWIYGGDANIPSLCTNPCGTSTDVDTDGTFEAGPATRLYQNSPNPFNPRTSIRFSLAAGGPAELIIYDVNGRKVKTLVSGNLTAGEHTEVWDGTDDAGRKVGAGVYWSQLEAGAYKTNKKMVILK